MDTVLHFQIHTINDIVGCGVCQKVQVTLGKNVQLHQKNKQGIYTRHDGLQYSHSQWTKDYGKSPYYIIWFDIYTSGWQITPNDMAQREIKSNPVILQCPFDLPSEEWKYRDTETNKWIRAEENEINIACIARGMIALLFLGPL